MLEAPIARMTDKTVTLADGASYKIGWCKRPIAEVDLTPVAAWARFAAGQERAVRVAAAALRQATACLEAAQTALNALNNEEK